MTDVSTLWTFSAQPITRERKKNSQHRNVDHSGSAGLDVDSSDEAIDEFAEEEARNDAGLSTSHNPQHTTALSEQAEDRRWLRSTNVVARAGSTQQTAELRTQQRIIQEARRAARGQHLPWRGDVAEDARVLRVLKGIQPLGSAADADQLSDWEDALDNAKMQRVRYGEKEIVQIGRRRTLAEEEHSHHEDELQRSGALGVPDLSIQSDMYGPVNPLPEETSAWTNSVSASFDLPRNRPRRSLPQRWTSHQTPAAAAAAAAISAAAHRSPVLSSSIAEDLDADIEDMD